MNRSKPVIALVHGWGMNARVFDTFVAALGADFDVELFNLPGHGGRAALADNALASWAADLAQTLPDGAIVLGWSLGGQVAMRAALDFPHKITRLVLLASTAKFVAAEDWPHGMAAVDLDNFAAALRQDPATTLLRFLSLQTRGMANQKSVLQSLRASLHATPPPTAQALEAGLAILRDADLRAELGDLQQPVLIMQGALDTLTPRAAGAWLAAQLPAATWVELPRAGHAPQLSHSDDVCKALAEFLNG